MLSVLTIFTSLTSFIKSLISGILDFATKKPSLFINIVLAIVLCFMFIKYSDKVEELEITKTELVKYKDVLEKEQKAHKKTIEDHNKAILDLKEKADQIAKENEAKAKEILDHKKKYKDLYDKYSSMDGIVPEDAEDRILRLELHNDIFFRDFKGVAK